MNTVSWAYYIWYNWQFHGISWDFLGNNFMNLGVHKTYFEEYIRFITLFPMKSHKISWNWYFCRIYWNISWFHGISWADFMGFNGLISWDFMVFHKVISQDFMGAISDWLLSSHVDANLQNPMKSHEISLWNLMKSCQFSVLLQSDLFWDCESRSQTSHSQ